MAAYTRGQARRVGAASTSSASSGSKNPSAATTSTACASCADALDATSTAGEYVADLYDAAGLLPRRRLPATGRHPLRRLHRASLRGAASRPPTTSSVSAHCAPALHAPVAARRPNLRHVEYFADHARLEPLLVDGIAPVRHGTLTPNRTVGHGYTLHPEERWQLDHYG